MVLNGNSTLAGGGVPVNTGCRVRRGFCQAFGLLAAIVFMLCPGASRAGQDPWGEVVDLKPGTVVSSSLLGSDPRAVGIFSGGLASFPVEGDSFVILSTGIAADAYSPDLNNRERLSFGYPWDDRSTILAGTKTSQGQDLVRLQMTLRAPGWAKGFAFDFAFFTEEWPDYFGSPFNDTFLVHIGENPGFQIDPDGTIHAPGNLAYDSNGGLISVNVGFGLDPAYPNPKTGTTFDGTTGLLTTAFPLPQDFGQTVTLTFTLFDAYDSILDSAVFLDNFRFLGEAPPAPVTAPADPVPPTTNTPPPPTFGKITGGGVLTADGAGGFAGNIHAPLHGGYRGNWRYSSRDGTLSLLAASIDTVDFVTLPGDSSGVPVAQYNTATVTGSTREGHRFRLTLIDRGEPGTADEFHIEAWSAGGTQLLNEGGVISSGNIQIHPPSP